MKIKHELPPNYALIRKYFPSANFDKGTTFVYGDTCYCHRMPNPDLLIHEEVHTKQQTNPKKWWKKYIKDPKFRLEQELEAYHAQWDWVKRNVKNRNIRFRIREGILRDVSGDLYNKMISFSEAEKLFRL